MRSVSRKITSVLNMLARGMVMRYSVKYHTATVKSYWSNTNKTHGDMSASNFNFYADSLLKLLDEFDGRKRVLDYGGGGGEIALRLSQHDIDVDVAEFSENFRNSIESKGLMFRDPKQLPLNYYNVVVANGCLYYEHPRNLVATVERIMASLNTGGVLLIADTPVLSKINVLSSSRIERWLFKITNVYQVEIGGFFFDADFIRDRFGAIERDSWCPYRSHFIITKE